MPEENESPVKVDAWPIAPRFLEITRRNGDALYVNIFAVASVLIPNGPSDTIIRMVDGREEIVIGDSNDVLLNLMDELSVFVDRED